MQRRLTCFHHTACRGVFCWLVDGGSVDAGLSPSMGASTAVHTADSLEVCVSAYGVSVGLYCSLVGVYVVQGQIASDGWQRSHTHSTPREMYLLLLQDLLPALCMVHHGVMILT